MINGAASAVGNPISSSALTGAAADIYKYLTDIVKISPGDITIYADDAGHLSVVLSQSAIEAVQGDLISHYADNLSGPILHPGYTDWARDARAEDSLHAVWIDPRLSTYFGIPGVYAQFHFDPANPYGGWGPFWKHAGCALFNRCGP
jgi:hypothetical protein